MKVQLLFIFPDHVHNMAIWQYGGKSVTVNRFLPDVSAEQGVYKNNICNGRIINSASFSFQNIIEKLVLDYSCACHLAAFEPIINKDAPREMLHGQRVFER